MNTRGVKQLDPLAELTQLDWLVLPIQACPNTVAEQQIAAVHFRVPHEPWAPERAFVQPVTVRRSRRRVLFLQCSGVG